ncbi:matrixin family metalloprotease [Candidatus Fukatsuia symbiotica]|nr:matrixin family metalloprotease [Candidatus Fukatsuia symbiotica]MEA9444846.1 matrixin family metalloprotease [Candidatus Fukatsuia symbiotica]
MSEIGALAKSLEHTQKWDKNPYKERVLTYRFFKPKYNGKTTEGHTNLTTYTDEQKRIAKSVLDEIAQKTGLEFRIAQDDEAGNLVFANYDSKGSFAPGGYADYPPQSGTSQIWTNFDDMYRFNRLIRHEIGHALGLLHAPDTSDPNSVMSYNHVVEELQPADILALQNLYGRDTNDNTDDKRRLKRGTHIRRCGTERFIPPENYQKKLTLRGADDQEFASFSIDKENSMLRLHLNKKFKHGSYYTIISIANRKGAIVFQKNIKKNNRKYSRYEIPFSDGYQIKIVELAKESEDRLRISNDVTGMTEVLGEETNFLMTATGLQKQAVGHEIKNQTSEESHINDVAEGLKGGSKWNKEAHQERIILRYQYPTPQYDATTSKYNYTNLTGYTDEQKEITKSVLDEIAEKTGLAFSQVANDQDADLSFINYNTHGEGANAGFTDYLPASQMSTIGTDTFNHTNREIFRSLVSHQIGHALGLNHSSFHPRHDSVMSNSLDIARLQPVDILALQKLYGVNKPVPEPKLGVESLVQEMSAFVSSPGERVPAHQDQTEQYNKAFHLTKPTPF